MILTGKPIFWESLYDLDVASRRPGFVLNNEEEEEVAQNPQSSNVMKEVEERLMKSLKETEERLMESINDKFGGVDKRLLSVEAYVKSAMDREKNMIVEYADVWRGGRETMNEPEGSADAESRVEAEMAEAAARAKVEAAARAEEEAAATALAEAAAKEKGKEKRKGKGKVSEEEKEPEKVTGPKTRKQRYKVIPHPDHIPEYAKRLRERERERRASKFRKSPYVQK